MDTGTDSPNNAERQMELDACALNDAAWEYVEQISKLGETMSARHWNCCKSILTPVIHTYLRVSRSDGATKASFKPKNLPIFGE